MISSWSANARAIASGLICHKRVEPSTSVNKSVTVPVGIGPTSGEFLTPRRAINELAGLPTQAFGTAAAVALVGDRAI
jgi:hypothetical protein